MSDEPEIVRIEDILRAGLCAAGARSWFTQQGFNFRDFMKNGIAAETLLATGDPYAIKVIDLKRERERG